MKCFKNVITNGVHKGSEHGYDFSTYCQVHSA
jgi:hypothetical protein